MKIASLACSFPERIVDNDEVIDLIREQSNGIFQGDLERALSSIDFFFDHTGLISRRWLRPGEPHFAHTEFVINEALKKANMSRSDIDLLIYTGLDKRVAEPGQSFFIAKALGMLSTQCFDVTEGCASWTRAVNISNALLETRQHERIMIVSGEFAMHEGERIFDNFALERKEDLDWCFPSYTLGESATATILTRDPDNKWEFRFSSHPEFADLCLIPLDEYPDHMGTMNEVSLKGKGAQRFVAYGKPMRIESEAPIRKLLNRFTESPQEYAVVLPHSHTKRFWVDLARDMGTEIPFHFVYPDYGNLVSGSIPGGLYTAVEEGKVKPGDRVFVMMASAGFSFSTYTFNM